MAKKSALTIVIIVVLSVAILFGLGTVMAPIIAENGSAAALGPLFEIMPDAKNFECIYSAEDAAASTLANVPGTVLGIYEETNGLGYALTLSTSEGYTKEPMNIVMAVGTDGKIIGTKVTAYPETKDMGVDSYPLTYVGQDSALADVSLVAGVTYASAAFKNAISDGFTALIENGLVGAGVKGDDQLLMEQLPALYTGIANASGVAQFEEIEASGSYIVRAMMNVNECGVAYIAKDGDNTYLAIVNLSGSCAVFNANGENVTDSVNPALIDEVTADAKTRLSADTSFQVKKLSALLGEDANITEIPAENVFNSVTNIYTVSVGGKTCYAMVSQPFGYGNMPMTFYYVLTEDGTIVKMTANNLILEPDYFSGYTLDEASYKAGFEGLAPDTFTDDAAVISGATISTDAAKIAARDSFAALAIITGNGGENNG